jgi:hypothetical protein
MPHVNLVTVWSAHVARRVRSRFPSHLGKPHALNSANWDNTNVLHSSLEFYEHNYTCSHLMLHNVFKWETNQDNTGTKASKQDREHSALHPYISRPTDCRPARRLTKRRCFSRRGGMVHKTTTLHNALYLSRWQGAVVSAEVLSDTRPLLNSISRLGHCHHRNEAKLEFRTQDAIC